MLFTIKNPTKKKTIKFTKAMITSAKLWQHALLNTFQCALQLSIMVFNDFYEWTSILSYVLNYVTSIMSVPSSFPLFAVFGQITTVISSPVWWVPILIDKTTEKDYAMVFMSIVMGFHCLLNIIFSFVTFRWKGKGCCKRCVDFMLSMFESLAIAILCILSTSFVCTLRIYDGKFRRNRLNNVRLLHGLVTSLITLLQSGFSLWYFVDYLVYEKGLTGEEETERTVCLYTMTILSGVSSLLLLPGLILFIIDYHKIRHEKKSFKFIFYNHKRKGMKSNAGALTGIMSNGVNTLMGDAVSDRCI